MTYPIESKENQYLQSTSLQSKIILKYAHTLQKSKYTMYSLNILKLRNKIYCHVFKRFK